MLGAVCSLGDLSTPSCPRWGTKAFATPGGFPSPGVKRLFPHPSSRQRPHTSPSRLQVTPGTPLQLQPSQLPCPPLPGRLPPLQPSLSSGICLCLLQTPMGPRPAGTLLAWRSKTREALVMRKRAHPHTDLSVGAPSPWHQGENRSN